MNLLLLKLAAVSDSFQKLDQVLGWTQLVEALPSMHRALGSTPTLYKPSQGNTCLQPSWPQRGSRMVSSRSSSALLVKDLISLKGKCRLEPRMS